MTIDTIRLESPLIDEGLAVLLERESIRRMGVLNRTGDVLYELTTGELKGTWDASLRFVVERKRWVKQSVGKPVHVDCQPYLVVEASPHKLIAGHNCWGGPLSCRAAGRWLLMFLADSFQVDLPDLDTWTLRRVDVSEVYELPTFDSVQEYIRGLSGAEYPRRKPHKYATDGLYFSGSTTALKFYHKGVEFWKHDSKRLRLLFRDQPAKLDEIGEIQLKANLLLRVEAEIKTRKLDYDHAKPLLLGEVDDSYLLAVHDTEVARILREAGSQMKQVRTARDVQARLHQVYDQRLAAVLFGTWIQLAALGEDAVKKSMARASFYRQRKQLMDAGVKWYGTNVILKEFSLVPADFSPVRNSSYRIVQELPMVEAALKAV